MKKLLNKTLFHYTVYTILILLVSFPFFYWTIQKLYKEDVDEAIELRKKEFLTNTLPTLQISEIGLVNRFNRDIQILPDTIQKQKFDIVFEQTFYDSLSPEWEPYRLMYSKVNIQKQPYILMIRLNLVESEDLISTLIRLYTGILLVLFVVIIFVTRYTSKFLWQPFYDTLAQIEQFNLEKHDVPTFQKSNISEFEQLNNSLGKLISANIQSYKTQKEFTENAAHELQTPIAVFKGKIDTLLQRSDITEEQFKILSALNDTVSRLSRLNKNLLLLSKIDNQQFNETSTFNFGELIKKPLDFFIEQAQSKGIKIETSINETIIINANAGLVEILVSNLLLNAIRHNVTDGTILIELTQNKLIVSNSSQNSQLNTTQLYNRFNKINPSSKGNGLGLAIIKKIADLYKWNIDYNFQNNLHQFSVEFSKI